MFAMSQEVLLQTSTTNAEPFPVPTDNANESLPWSGASQQDVVADTEPTAFALEEHPIDETPDLKVCRNVEAVSKASDLLFGHRLRSLVRVSRESLLAFFCPSKFRVFSSPS